MRKGVDYSVRVSNWSTFAKSLVSNGRTFVGRYLASDLAYMPRDRRALTTSEAEALAEAGIDIFVWWENSPDHKASHTERRALDGYAAGVSDARLAQVMLNYFGQPNAPIFFTVDYDLSGSSIANYFLGACTVVGLERMGSYAGYHVTKYLFDRNLITYACQTEAWSRFLSNGNMSGKGTLTWDNRAQLRQWTTTKPGYAGNIGGVDCDGLDAMADDFGQWRYGITRPKNEEEDEMTSEQTEKLLDSNAKNGFRSAISVALAIGWTDEVKRLNDEFYKRWPREDKYKNLINSSGLPVVWPTSE